jgi:hypothetical protein
LPAPSAKFELIFLAFKAYGSEDAAVCEMV